MGIDPTVGILVHQGRAGNPFPPGDNQRLHRTLRNPQLAGRDLSYEVQVLEGTPLASAGAASLFIDIRRSRFLAELYRRNLPAIQVTLDELQQEIHGDF